MLRKRWSLLILSFIALAVAGVALLRRGSGDIRDAVVVVTVEPRRS